MELRKIDLEIESHASLARLEHLYQQGRISRRALLRAMALLGVSAAAAACVPSAPIAEQQPTVVPVSASTPTPAQPRVLRIGWPFLEASTFDIASTGSGAFPVVSLMYEGLVRYKGGTSEIEPLLAKSWEISPDNTAVTFYLQEGVQWQRGYGEFTADDVKFTIERIVNEKLPEAVNWQGLDHVEVVDKHTVKIVMQKPSPTLFTLSLPFQAGMIVCKKAVEELGAKAFNETPVGTGPYELVSYTIGESVQFKRFDRYWGTRVLDVDEVVWILTSDTLTALQAGNIDITNAGMKALADIKKMSGIASAYRLTRYWWISLPCTHPILKDINARKAIRAAIDVAPIIEVSGLGMGVRGYAMVPPGIIGHWEDAPHYERDVDQAKQFLKDAGYPDGFTVPFLAISSPPDPGVELIRQQLEEIGIKLDTQAVDSNTYWSLAPEGKHMTLISYQTLPDGIYTLQYFASGEFWNTMKWSNQGFDQLLEQARTEMNQEKRHQMLVEMQKLMDEDCAMVYVGYQPQGVAYREGILNLGPSNEALLVNGVLDASRIRVL